MDANRDTLIASLRSRPKPPARIRPDNRYAQGRSAVAQSEQRSRLQRVRGQATQSVSGASALTGAKVVSVGARAATISKNKTGDVNEQEKKHRLSLFHLPRNLTSSPATYAAQRDRGRIWVPGASNANGNGTSVAAVNEDSSRKEIPPMRDWRTAFFSVGLNGRLPVFTPPPADYRTTTASKVAKVHSPQAKYPVVFSPPAAIASVSGTASVQATPSTPKKTEVKDSVTALGRPSTVRSATLTGRGRPRCSTLSVVT